VVAMLAGAVVLPAGCGEDSDGRPRLVVSAAASMNAALSSCSPDFDDADVRLSFAGSDVLAAQIRGGFRPDLYAAANTELPGRLHAEGLLEEPVRFATNEIVAAVPAESDVSSLRHLAAQGRSIAIGSDSAPIGTYTREALSRLPRAIRQAILANVRSREPDVSGIVGKLTQGAADAGFVYRSDVQAAGRRLRSVRLPRGLRPSVVYAAAVVRGARRPGLARRYLRGLVAGRCRAALTAAGFGRPR